MVTRSLPPLPWPHDDLAAHELHILHAQGQALVDAHAGAVHEPRHQRVHAVHAVEDRSHLVVRQHGGQALRAAGARDPLERLELEAEHLAIQEEDRRERLVLRRCRDATLVGERGEERDDMLRAQLAGMAPAVEADEALHPLRIGALGAQAVVAQADALAQGFEERRRGGRRYHNRSWQDRGDFANAGKEFGVDLIRDVAQNPGINGRYPSLSHPPNTS